jgi:hypothetical protein
MATGLRRNSYVRRGSGETRIEDRGDPNEVTIQDLTELSAALTAWERKRAQPKPKRVAPPVWHKQDQVRIKQPLWVLLARSAVAEGVAAGLVRRGGGSTDGWADQVLCGESPYAKPALW